MLETPGITEEQRFRDWLTQKGLNYVGPTYKEDPNYPLFLKENNENLNNTQNSDNNLAKASPAPGSPNEVFSPGAPTIETLAKNPTEIEDELEKKKKNVKNAGIDAGLSAIPGLDTQNNSQTMAPNTGMQSPTSEIPLDPAIETAVKTALQDFNVADMKAGPSVMEIKENMVGVLLSPYQASFVENAIMLAHAISMSDFKPESGFMQTETSFRLAGMNSTPKGKTVYRALGLTPGYYLDNKGNYIKIDTEYIKKIAPLFRSKPLILVDNAKITPQNTHAGDEVGFIANSFYCPDIGGMMFDFELDDNHLDLDLSSIAGASPMWYLEPIERGEHIAIMKKCSSKEGLCAKPQDPNTGAKFPYQQFIRNAVTGKEDKMTNDIVAKHEAIIKEKQPLVKAILMAEIEKKECLDPEVRLNDLYSKDLGTLVAMAQVAGRTPTPSGTIPNANAEPLGVALAKMEDPLDFMVKKYLYKVI